MAVDSADEFYSIMGVLTREMLEFGLMDCNELVQTIVSMAPFPFPQLQELREKYTFDIRPFANSATGGSNAHRKTSIRDFVGLRLFYTDEDDDGELDEDQLALASAAWYLNQRHGKANVTLDIGTLKRQYARLRDRQRQAHVILTSTLKTAIEQQAHPDGGRPPTRPAGRARLPVNSLLAGHKPIVRKVRPTPKVQFTMPPDEVGRESNRPRGPRAMRTKMMIDERTDLHKQQPGQGSHQSKHKLNRQLTNQTQQRGETLTWEQIERERREKRESGSTRTRSWSSSSDDSSSTSLCDQGLLEAEGDSSSLCVSPLPGSPRSPRLPPSTDSPGSVFQTPSVASCSTSSTILAHKNGVDTSSSGDSNDKPLDQSKIISAAENDATISHQLKGELSGAVQKGQIQTLDENRSSFAKSDSSDTPTNDKVEEVSSLEREVVPTVVANHGEVEVRSENSIDLQPESLKTVQPTEKGKDVAQVPMPDQLLKVARNKDDAEVNERETVLGNSACADAQPDIKQDVDDRTSFSTPLSNSNVGCVDTVRTNTNIVPSSPRKLIIADAPRNWSPLSEDKDSPLTITAAPQMWHQIPEGPFVEDGETDSTDGIAQSTSGPSRARIKEKAATPPSLDELLERYTKVTHLVEDASARLVASTSIDSGDSRTPPSRADSPPAVPFNPFPTQRTSALNNQVARKLGLYSNH